EMGWISIVVESVSASAGTSRARPPTTTVPPSGPTVQVVASPSGTPIAVGAGVPTRGGCEGEVEPPQAARARKQTKRASDTTMRFMGLFLLDRRIAHIQESHLGKSGRVGSHPLETGPLARSSHDDRLLAERAPQLDRLGDG